MDPSRPSSPPRPAVRWPYPTLPPFRFEFPLSEVFALIRQFFAAHDMSLTGQVMLEELDAMGVVVPPPSSVPPNRLEYFLTYAMGPLYGIGSMYKLVEYHQHAAESPAHLVEVVSLLRAFDPDKTPLMRAREDMRLARDLADSTPPPPPPQPPTTHAHVHMARSQSSPLPGAGAGPRVAGVGGDVAALLAGRRAHRPARGARGEERDRGGAGDDGGARAQRGGGGDGGHGEADGDDRHRAERALSRGRYVPQPGSKGTQQGSPGKKRRRG